MFERVQTFPSAPPLPMTQTQPQPQSYSSSSSDYECLSNYQSNDLYGTGLDKSASKISSTTLVPPTTTPSIQEHVYENVNHMNRSTTSNSISSTVSSSSSSSTLSSTSKLVPFLDSNMSRNRSTTNFVNTAAIQHHVNTPRSTSTFIDTGDETVSSGRVSLSPDVSEIESLSSR